jgi:hypothetical protein
VKGISDRSYYFQYPLAGIVVRTLKVDVPEADVTDNPSFVRLALIDGRLVYDGIPRNSSDSSPARKTLPARFLSEKRVSGPFCANPKMGTKLPNRGKNKRKPTVQSMRRALFIALVTNTR